MIDPDLERLAGGESVSFKKRKVGGGGGSGGVRSIRKKDL